MSKNSVSYLLQGWRGRGQTPPTLTVVPAALLLEQQRQLSFAHQNPLTPHEIQDESGDDRSVRLNRISGIAIILNTIMFSLEIDFANPTGLPEDRVFWILVESIFIVIFSVEIVLRIHMEGRRWPCSLWNWRHGSRVVCHHRNVGFEFLGGERPPACAGFGQGCTVGSDFQGYPIVPNVSCFVCCCNGLQRSDVWIDIHLYHHARWDLCLCHLYDVCGGAK